MHNDSPRQTYRLRPAPAGEAKGQTLIRRPRTPIPWLLHRGLAQCRQHRDALMASSTPPRQCRPSPRFRHSRAQPANWSATDTSPSTAAAVDIPSYLVKAGDVIRVKIRKKSLEAVPPTGRSSTRSPRFPQPRRRRPTRRPRRSSARSLRRLPADRSATDHRIVLQVVAIHSATCLALHAEATPNQTIVFNLSEVAM